MSNGLNLMRRQIKDQIQLLINNGSLEEANTLLDQYFIMAVDDVEAYSIKAVLLIMQKNFAEAEKTLVEGLNIDPSYKDLLFNMSYLMDITRRNKNALHYYCRGKLFNPYSDIRVEDTIEYLNPIDSNNLRIVHGTMEIANQMYTICKGLNYLGVKAQTMNYYPSYLGYTSDYTLNLNSFKNINEANYETKILASRVIEENDVFHFHFGTSLTLDYSDLPLLKELKKKVIMQYWGSDVRLYSKAVKLNPYVKVKDMNEDGIKRKLEYLSRFIPDCLGDYEVEEYTKDYHSKIHLTRVALDLNNYKFVNETNNNKLLIVHAPTSPEFKGTNYILKAIEELKVNYDFDFKLVQGMSHEEARKVYEKADLIIDQILAGSYGVFAVESMAMGKPVISWISDFMKEKYPKELPIISANPDSIKEKIQYAINNRDMLKEVGKSGRMYVEKYHDYNIISQKMLRIYKDLQQGGII